MTINAGGRWRVESCYCQGILFVIEKVEKCMARSYGWEADEGLGNAFVCASFPVRHSTLLFCLSTDDIFCSMFHKAEIPGARRTSLCQTELGEALLVRSGITNQ